MNKKSTSFVDFRQIEKSSKLVETLEEYHETQTVATKETTDCLESARLIQSGVSALTKRRCKTPSKWRIVALREICQFDKMTLCDTPQSAVKYWRMHIVKASPFNPDVECLFILLLDIRRYIIGHQLVSIGSLNDATAYPREVFRAAVIAAAAAIVIMHNHPSGDPTPSNADLKVTHALVAAGKVLHIEVLDHVIVGRKQHCSLLDVGHI